MTTDAQDICRIAIIRGKEGTFRVVPGHVFVPAGTPIVFSVIDAGSVALVFPDEGLFGEQCFINLRSGNSTKKGQFVAHKEGNYPYCAFVGEARDFAVGDSHPRIVVGDSDEG